ncbi:variable surface protein Vir21, putative [Plasmodium vivax]|uniref:Variable surface protein Vir21, putative n=1 Tax=Plasmodium vivax (strain Salvador I) TaxID=126793 RepID=A5K1K8_PLAVS|nr:variable surface protein Vir21, putative [Plasmodium vivax]EDL47205.1 variable surface protein Vir21, putative [Plasmodium vivax]|eukprot:XP_001616932.1 variable surface protein Vir21 [Plasmodium vivax Sal-1]
MASNAKAYTLKDFSDNNHELKKTDLYTFYHHHFDKICDNTADSLYFCDSFNGDKSLDSPLQEFYRKLDRNLKLIPKLLAQPAEDISVDKHKLCFYLKYWFYDQVIAKEIKNAQITQLLSIWERNKREKSFECEHDVKSLPIIKKLKEYYDYYLFFEAYNNTDNMNKEICNKKYCKYLEDARYSYLLFTTKCFSKNDNSVKEYCNEFIEYIMEYLKIYDKSSISCQPVESSEEEDTSHQEEVKASGKVSPPRGVRGVEEDEDDDDIAEEPGTEEEGEEVKMGFGSPFTPGFHTPGRSISHRSTEIDNLMPIVYPSPTSEDTSRKTSTVASVSSVGIGCTLYLLYKFTPVGSFLYPRVQNIKNKINNLIGGQTEVQQDAYNFYPTHMDMNRINIAYQSR